MAIKRDGHFITVGDHIRSTQREVAPGASGTFSWMLTGITLAGKMIASYVRRAGLIDVWGETGDENVQGEEVKKLDILANDTLKRTLGYRGNVGIIASEEDDEPRVIHEIEDEDAARYIIMFDPLDGSSNIDANVSIGTIWTIFRNPPDIKGVERSVLQPGTEQVAAGYILYGSSTVLVMSLGQGVDMFTLDNQFGTFLLTRENIQMPEHKDQYSVNEAYSHRFPEPYKKYLAWAKERRGGGGNYSMRYIGSLVADFHRILVQGGVFLYPPTDAQPEGKLRLMYECNPLAMLAEQAGGLAYSGHQRTLDIEPRDVHDRVPFVVGSRKNVEEIQRFVEES